MRARVPAPMSFSKPATTWLARSCRRGLDPSRREVEEVVRLDELLVAGALRVEAARQPQAALPAEGDGGREAGRQHHVAVDGAPLQAQPGSTSRRGNIW